MKYYTYSLFTPTGMDGYREVKARYRNAPLGFVFHDSERPLEITDIRAAMATLHKLVLTEHEDEEEYVHTPRAIVLRSDPNTLAVTFSMSGFPVPARHNAWRQEGHLFPLPSDEPKQSGTNYLNGWLLSDVTTLAGEVTPVSFGDLYDNCGQLVKLGGGCPCELLTSGQCMEFTVLPQLPTSFVGPMNIEYDVDRAWLTRKQYRSIDGFEFVKPGYTVTGDFSKAERPYDNHDFSVVEQRKEEFKARGGKRQRENTFREKHCAVCHFGTLKKDGSPQSCNYLSSCTTASTEKEAWTYLEARYNSLHFEDMPGFSDRERDYLIHLGSTKVHTTGITGRRAIDGILAGFIRVGGVWKFQISAAKGNLTRSGRFSNYQAFHDTLEDTPHVVPSKEIPDVEISHKARMACAFLGHNPHVYAYGKGALEVYRSTYTATGQGGYVTRTGLNTSCCEQGHQTLNMSEPAKDWFDALYWAPSEVPSLVR